MKFIRTALALCFVAATSLVTAQENSVGINTDGNLNPNAVLELVSPNSNQGFLVPRITTSERNNMSLSAIDNGLMVFDVDAEEGITEHGRIDHNVGASCSSWWTEPSSWVRRSVFMDNFVYSVAPDRIIVAHLDDLSTPVATVELPR